MFRSFTHLHSLLTILLIIILAGCSDPVSDGYPDIQADGSGTGENAGSNSGDAGESGDDESGNDDSGDNEDGQNDDEGGSHPGNGNGNSGEDGDEGGSPDPDSFQPADILINEFMVRQENTIADPDFNQYSGWIELRNRESAPVDLGGWIIAGRDPESGTSRQYALPEGTVIPPDDLMLIWTSGEGAAAEKSIHTSFRLPQNGGLVGLYGPGWAGKPVVDTISYEHPDVSSDISIGRMHFNGEFDHPGFVLPMTAPTPGQPNRLEQLRILTSRSLDISDPSGLDVDHSGNYFWTISDDPGGSIYKIDLEGNIADELDVGGHDMEAITQHPEDLTLYVAEERLRQIVQYDTLGNELNRFDVDVEVQQENDGLEGITVNPETNHIYVVNEQNPRVLIELDLSRPEREQQVMYKPMDFRAGEEAKGLDLSGLFFDDKDGVLWGVSDEARAVFALDPGGRPLAAYHAGRVDLEGIAIIRETNRMYLVSDERQELFIFAYPETRRDLSASP